MVRFSLLLLVLLCLLSNCQKVENPEQDGNHTFDEVAMIEWFNSFNPQWQESIRKNDPSYIISRYDDNAIIGADNQPFIRGKAAITQYWQNLAEFLDDFGYETQYLRGNPKDLIFEMGIAYSTFTIDNQQKTDTTKYLFVWQYVNGEYKVLSEMFNARKPSN